MDVFNALTKSESLILSYKPVTEVGFFCFVNKVWVMLLSTYVYTHYICFVLL